jgi:hypothetical protein
MPIPYMGMMTPVRVCTRCTTIIEAATAENAARQIKGDGDSEVGSIDSHRTASSTSPNNGSSSQANSNGKPGLMKNLAKLVTRSANRTLLDSTFKPDYQLETTRVRFLSRIPTRTVIDATGRTRYVPQQPALYFNGNGVDLSSVPADEIPESEFLVTAHALELYITASPGNEDYGSGGEGLLPRVIMCFETEHDMSHWAQALLLNKWICEMINERIDDVTKPIFDWNNCHECVNFMNKATALAPLFSRENIIETIWENSRGSHSTLASRVPKPNSVELLTDQKIASILCALVRDQRVGNVPTGNGSTPFRDLLDAVETELATLLLQTKDLDAIDEIKTSRMVSERKRAKNPIKGLGNLIGARKRRGSLLSHEEAEISRREKEAIAFMEKGDYLQASGVFETILEMRSKELEPHDPVCLAAMDHLAQALCCAHDLESAQIVLEQSWQIKRTHHGEMSDAAVGAAQLLAYVMCSPDHNGRHDYMRAEELYRFVHSTRAKKLGKSHVDTLSAQYDLGSLLLERGTVLESESLMRDAYLRCCATLGQTQEFTLTCGLGLALVLSGMPAAPMSQIPIKPDQLLQEIIETCETHLGETHSLTIKALSALASLCEKQGNFEIADAYYTKVVAASSALDEEVLTKSKADLKNTKNNAANIPGDRSSGIFSAPRISSRCSLNEQSLSQVSGTFDTLGRMSLETVEESDDKAGKHHRPSSEPQKKLLNRRNTLRSVDSSGYSKTQSGRYIRPLTVGVTFGSVYTSMREALKPADKLKLPMQGPIGGVTHQHLASLAVMYGTRYYAYLSAAHQSRSARTLESTGPSPVSRHKVTTKKSKRSSAKSQPKDERELEAEAPAMKVKAQELFIAALATAQAAYGSNSASVHGIRIEARRLLGEEIFAFSDYSPDKARKSS